MKGIKLITRLKYLLVLILLFLSGYIEAQIFGGNPAGQKWLQYHSDSVRVIFPSGMEDAAQRIILHAKQIRENDKSSLGNKFRKIDVIVQNGRTESNAYVGLAPWRSEFYSIPPQDPFQMGAIDWIDNLTIHEFRHVQQFSNFNKGLSSAAYFLLGEQGLALANAAAIPDWFFEGDAVYNETKFSAQGRGKLALFLSSYKSLYLAEKHYSFMQLRNGSYRKYMPNHYELGFLLVTYGRKKFGDSIWTNICSDAVKFKSVVYPFQNALKKYTGISYQQFIHDAFSYYQDIWKDEMSEKAVWLTQNNPNDVVDYRYPYLGTDGSIIVLKKSLKKIPAFYIIKKDGTEQKIADRSISYEDDYSYKNQRIIYIADQPDKRWGNREYHSIKVLDLKEGKEKTFLSHTKYYSPDISTDGKQIVVIELDPIAGLSLVLLDIKGNVLKRVKKEGHVFASPKFSADNQSIFFTASNKSGEMSLLKASISKNDSLKTILPFANRLIGYLNVQNDTLIYTSSNKGRDEIWSTILKSDNPENFRMASFPTGLYQGLIQSDGKLVSSVFSADGYRLASFTALWEPSAAATPLKNLSIPELYTAKDESLLKSKPVENLVSQKYASLNGLIRLHSWRPIYSDPEYMFSIYGDNILNTFHSELAYTFNQNERSHRVGVAGTFGGTYLQPIFGWDQIWSRSGYYHTDTLLHWNESNAYLGLQLPLNFSEGKLYRYFNLSSAYHFDQLNWTGLGKSIFKDQEFNTIQSRVDWLSQVQQAKQQILPHWGQRLTAQYKTAIGAYTAHQLLLSGSVYLPGFSNNHGIALTGAYYQRDTLQQYLFSNNFPFSRGFTAIDFPRMWKMGINYHLPIAYPEWGLGNLVYCSRVRVNLFYDHSIGKSLRTGNLYIFSSTGAELYFDTKWWNQQSISFGIRYCRLLNNEYRGQTQPNGWEFIMPINLF